MPDAHADARLRRRHALDRLVEVLVQGIAPVRRQDQIRHCRAHAAVPGEEGAARLVRALHVARKGRNRPLVVVDHGVDDEGEPRPPRRPDHVPVDWVALEHARARPRIVDEGRAVVRKHGPAPRDAREHALAPAREPREEVRLDEPLRHQQIRLRREAVDHQRPARGQRPQADEVRLVVAVVNHDLLPRVQLRPELFAQLLRRGRAVAARGDQQRDLRRRVSAPDLLEHRRQDRPARHGPRVVAQEHDDLLLAARELAQARRADRVVQRAPHERLFAVVACRQLRGQHRRKVFVGQVGAQLRPPVGEVHDCHGCIAPFLFVAPAPQRSPGSCAEEGEEFVWMLM